MACSEVCVQVMGSLFIEIIDGRVSPCHYCSATCQPGSSGTQCSLQGGCTHCPLRAMIVQFTNFSVQLQPPVAQPRQPIAQSNPPVAQPQQTIIQPKPPVAQPRQPIVQPKPPVAQSQQPVAPSRAPPPTVPKPKPVAPPPSSTGPPLTEKEIIRAILEERYAQYLEVCVCVSVLIEYVVVPLSYLAYCPFR